MRRHFITILGLALFLISCEKTINVDLPDTQEKLVVEGRIEQGQVAYVILTKSTGFFEPTNVNAIENLFVHDAEVFVSSEGALFELAETCLNDLPPELRPIVADALGLNPDQLEGVNYCIYFNPALIGRANREYELSIKSEGRVYSASTSIPEPAPLDSLWFEQREADGRGFVWAAFNEPDAPGNAYRWFARRISTHPDGTPKDSRFIAPLGSVFDDRFVNGISFEFGFPRGDSDNPELEQENPGFYFEKDDTVAVKFTSIDLAHYDFLRVYEAEISSEGNPFASPTLVPSNISGGALGIWGGYGVYLDTLYPNP